jgi:hypothetical protein
MNIVPLNLDEDKALLMTVAIIDREISALNRMKDVLLKTKSPESQSDELTILRNRIVELERELQTRSPTN